MIKIDIRRRENADSRYGGHDCFEDVEIVQADSREELLAQCYGIRKTYKDPAEVSRYDSADFVRFIGPFEVMPNDSWKDEKGKKQPCFDTWRVSDEYRVKLSVDEGAVLHGLLK